MLGRIWGTLFEEATFSINGEVVNLFVELPPFEATMGVWLFDTFSPVFICAFKIIQYFIAVVDNDSIICRVGDYPALSVAVHKGDLDLRSFILSERIVPPAKDVVLLLLLSRFLFHFIND